MKHQEILKRAWSILWDYKVLWIFGFFLALTTVSSSSRIIEFSSPGQGQDQPITINPGADVQEQFDDAVRELRHFFDEVVPAEVISTVTTIAIVLGCLFVLLLIVKAILRHVSDAAMLKLVDEYERTGEKRGVREGFQAGWSPTAWRLFLLNLSINIPAVLIFILYMVFAMLPFFLWSTKSVAAGVIGSVTAIGLFFLGILAAILVGALLSLLKQFFRRACALEDLGIGASLRRGFALARQNWQDVGLMWLLTFGINLGYALLMIPLGFLVFIIAAVFGGSIGMAAAAIANTFAGSGLAGAELSIIIGVLVGLPFFFLTIMVPLGFVGGLRETFISSTWTLSYRELLALEEIGEQVEEDLELAGLPDPEG